MPAPSRPRTAVIAASLLAAASLASGAGAAIAKPGGTPAIPLNPQQETTGSDTGASGFFSYTISGTSFCYTLTVSNLSAPAGAAHIHHGPRRVAGPIVIPLEVPHETSFTTSACTTVTDSALLSDISANPKAYYVNVHTATFPGGEIRGQLK